MHDRSKVTFTEENMLMGATKPLAQKNSGVTPQGYEAYKNLLALPVNSALWLGRRISPYEGNH